MSGQKKQTARKSSTVRTTPRNTHREPATQLLAGGWLKRLWTREDGSTGNCNSPSAFHCRQLPVCTPQFGDSRGGTSPLLEYLFLLKHQQDVTPVCILLGIQQCLVQILQTESSPPEGGKKRKNDRQLLPSSLPGTTISTTTPSCQMPSLKQTCLAIRVCLVYEHPRGEGVVLPRISRIVRAVIAIPVRHAAMPSTPFFRPDNFPFTTSRILTCPYK